MQNIIYLYTYFIDSTHFEKALDICQCPSMFLTCRGKDYGIVQCSIPSVNFTLVHCNITGYYTKLTTVMSLIIKQSCSLQCLPDGSEFVLSARESLRVCGKKSTALWATSLQWTGLRAGFQVGTVRSAQIRPGPEAGLPGLSSVQQQMERYLVDLITKG